MSTAPPTVRSKIGRGLGTSAVGNIVLRLGNVGVSIVVARLLLPEQFGVFAVALTVWSVLGTLAELGLGTDLIRSVDDADFERRAPTVQVLALITSGILGAAMIIAAGPISAAFRSPDSAAVVQVMAISLFVFGFTVVPAAKLAREFRQGTIFLVNLVALLCSATTVVALATAGLGPVSLAVGQIATQVVTAIGLHIAARCRIRIGFDATVARASLRLCLPLGLANMISWVLLSVDNLIVARTLSPLELGLYALAFNVSSWPMSAVGQSIRAVALPAFARLSVATDRARALVTVSGPLWAVALLLGIGLATLAEPVITALYGPRWSAAAVALTGLAVFGAFRVVFDLLATFLASAGQTRSVLVVQVVWLVIMVPTMVVAVRRFGLPGAGWAHAAVAGLAVLPLYLLCLRRIGVSPRAFLAAWVRPTILAVPATLATVAVAHLLDAPWPTLLLGGAVVLLTYVAPLATWVRRQLGQLSDSTAPTGAVLHALTTTTTVPEEAI